MGAYLGQAWPVMRSMCSVLFALWFALAACSGGDPIDRVTLEAPDELLDSGSAEVAVLAWGEPHQQLSMALSASAGVFEKSAEIVLTNAEGMAEFRTRYTASDVGGDETLTASVSTLGGSAVVEARPLRVVQLERVGTPALIGLPAPHTDSVLVAYPITLTGAGTVERLGVIAPEQSPAGPVRVHLGLYKTQSATSIEALASVSAQLVAGRNEVAIPPQALTPDTYWLVTMYEGTPLIYRSETELVAVRYKTWTYAAGVPATIADLQTSAASLPSNAVRVYRRSLYLAVRPPT